MKINCIKLETVDPEIHRRFCLYTGEYRLMKTRIVAYFMQWLLNFDLLEKGLEQVSPPNSVHDFLKKVFFMLYSINWQNFIVWLSNYNCLCPNCDVIHSDISLIFIIKPFCNMTKESKQKFKCFENEKSFWGEIKINSHNFKRLSVAKSYYRPDSFPLSKTFITLNIQ